MQNFCLPVRPCLTGIFLSIFSFLLFAHSGHKEKPEQKPQVLAPGYRTLSFDAPPAGSYDLPIIGKAANGNILNMQGQAQRLHDFLGDKFVVLSFIYTQCDDINGCPLATYVSSQVQNRLLQNPVLKNEVRFISLSFDPANDTPETMQKYGHNFIQESFDWQFLTTESEKDLDPILEKYSQSILRDVDENGETSSSISHILRVFLIDKQKQIRNIYSTSFLHPDTIVNDIKTLATKSIVRTNRPPIKKAHNSDLHGAGDFKKGYERNDYQTRALSLQTRTGKETDLLRYLNKPPLGLPAIPFPNNKKTNKGKVKLGRRLFYDRRLSHNNTFSCAMCHIPEQGFGSNELATSVGVEGRTVRRNAPTLYNIAYARKLFHDSRENSLEQQIWGPLLSHNEMANPSVGHVVDKIKSIPEYQALFQSAYGKQLPDMKNIGEAIASYERALVSANSNFDRWLYASNKNAMSAAAIAGYRLFSGKARCISCHTIEQDSAIFSDYELHNTGVGYLNSMAKSPKSQKVLVAPGIWLDVDSSVMADSAEPKPNDLGYYEISGLPDDRWKYRTPTLRNVALTAPYMHNGSLSTLRDVIEFYNKGGIANELLDPVIKPLNLSTQEINELIAFLNNLTGDNIDELISDAFAAPVGNTH